MRDRRPPQFDTVNEVREHYEPERRRTRQVEPVDVPARLAARCIVSTARLSELTGADEDTILAATEAGHITPLGEDRFDLADPITAAWVQVQRAGYGQKGGR